MEETFENSGDDTFYSMDPQNTQEVKAQDRNSSNPPLQKRSRSSRTSESEIVEGLETVSLEASTDVGSMGIQLNTSFAVATFESKSESTPVKSQGNDVVDATTITIISKPKEFPSVNQYFDTPEPSSIPPSDPKTFFDHLSSEMSPMMKSVADITALDDKEGIEVAIAADERESATLSCPEVTQEETQNKPEIDKKPSLQSLFNEDKFGSDVVGKAFFDAIAGQTIETSTDKTPDSVESVKATTEAIPFESPKSSPESFFSESFDQDSYHDAWIPCQKSQVTLRAAVTSPPGTYFPDKADLTMPGVIIEDQLVRLMIFDLCN